MSPDYRSVSDRIAAHALAFPDRTHLEFIDQGNRATWADTCSFCGELGHFLHSLDVRANDRVAVLAENSLETLLLFFGVLSHGATLCPIDYTATAQQVPELLARVRPKVIIRQRHVVPSEVGDGSGARQFSFEAGSLAGQRDAMGSDDDLFDLLPTYKGLERPQTVGGPEDAALILFTSGTSSRPKAPMHSHGSLLAASEAGVVQWETTAGDRILDYRSFAWASPVISCQMGTIVSGATLVFARKFSRSRFFQWIDQFRPTIAVGVPMVINLLAQPSESELSTDMTSLRFFTCSTAPLSLDRFQSFEALYGIPIIEHYGMSEAACIAGNRPGRRRLGSVGIPHPDQGLRILRPDGTDCPIGEVGEIQVGGPQNVMGFLMEDGSVAPFERSGFKTGDLGYLDGDGFLHLTGRTKEIIIRNGINVSPAEIDSVLLSHDAVEDAATIGVPDPISGEQVVCFVVARQGVTLGCEEILAFCQAVLPPPKRPAEAHLVDAIPRSERGKIDRARLREHWEASMAPQLKRSC